MKFPRSPYDKIQGLVYFPRLTDKIRLHAAGELTEDYHENLGKGFDQRCCDFLRVSYADLTEKVLGGSSDEDALEWCFTHGRRPTEEEIFIWSEFLRKRGWNDEAKGILEKRIAEAGFSDRTDIETMFDFIVADETR